LENQKAYPYIVFVTVWVNGWNSVGGITLPTLTRAGNVEPTILAEMP